MSRHLEILRRAKLDAELFSRAGAGENGHTRRPGLQPVLRTSWATGHARDQWQQLVHELFLRRRHDARYSLGLTSATAGEGTSYIAAHLAAELARSAAQPTLLVEANLYRPAQAERYGVEPEPGLRHLLLDPSFPLEACLRQTAIDCLWLLPAGSASNGLAGAPDWSRFQQVFEGLRRRFAAVIADLPPVNPSADALIIGPVLDAVVLVVGADLRGREAIQNAAARLRRANPNLLGTILNKRKFFIPAAIYRLL